mgnify:CR=1 FL=1
MANEKVAVIEIDKKLLSNKRDVIVPTEPERHIIQLNTDWSSEKCILYFCSLRF